MFRARQQGGPPPRPARERGLTEKRLELRFPGWKVHEIFGALTEDPWTAGTISALERVALAMGAREGTRPEDDPFTRSLSAKAQEEGREEGRAEGDARGYARGRNEMLRESVRAVLAGRGIEAVLDSSEDRALFGALPAEILMAAALACTGEADFRRRVRQR